MEVCYILLVHRDPAQVNKLIEKLSYKTDQFVIHVDAKSDICEAILKGDNVHFVQDRVSVCWGDYSVVQAEINAIREALAATNSDRYVLLSGEDYPLISVDKIHQKFEKEPGLNYLHVVSSDNPKYRLYCKRHELWYPRWMMQRSLVPKVIKHVYMLITGGYKRSVLKRKQLDIKSYFGSQWWALNRYCVEYFIAYLDGNEQLTSFFKHTLVPDESIMQTVIMNSPFRDTVSGRVTYVNWKDDPSPHYFGSEDIPLLIKIKERYMFARKFHQEKSKDCIDFLDSDFDES